MILVRMTLQCDFRPRCDAVVEIEVNDLSTVLQAAKELQGWTLDLGKPGRHYCPLHSLLSSTFTSTILQPVTAEFPRIL